MAHLGAVARMEYPSEYLGEWKYYGVHGGSPSIHADRLGGVDPQRNCWLQRVLLQDVAGLYVVLRPRSPARFKYFVCSCTLHLHLCIQNPWLDEGARYGCLNQAISSVL